MCNCGNKRNEFTKRQQAPAPPANFVQQPFVQNKQTVLFEYTGNTALTVTGTITRKIYRFNFPGDKQAVEPGDANAMMAVPVLKKIS